MMGNMNQPKKITPLALAALGVVYGDIGTSPLYTLSTIFTGGLAPVPLNPENILGILSLIFWSLMIVVSFKYVVFIMRADNRGEGGIMALLALALQHLDQNSKQRTTIMLLGIFGAALFYGDGVITPAISVLSAVEGLQVASPALHSYIIPITIAVLFGLFMFQRKGTASVGAIFGPVMLLWFSTLALLGIINIIHEPSVMNALNPVHGIRFLTDAPWIGFLALGGVVLAVTGAETLYADMGHFGRRPVQLAWFVLVLPALLLNYFGQGALLIHTPKAIANPFYLLAPNWALYPLIMLATVATVIASQAVISGAFSITRQAMQLGYVPRMNTQQTSEHEYGQIYLPGINWALFIAVVALVIGFRSSSNLGSAYGIAVTGTMAITSILAFIVVRKIWGWGWIKGGLLIATLLSIDLAFFSANIIKIEEGGWFPLAFAFGIFLLMTTWKRGRQLLRDRMQQNALTLIPFIAAIQPDSITRVTGSAIFLTANPNDVPHALLHNLKHNKVLHEHVVILSVNMLDIPYVANEERLAFQALANNFYRVIIKFGFKDEPDIPKAIAMTHQFGLTLDPMETSYFLGRETLIPKTGTAMPLWREKLFVTMYRNASSAVTFFNIPPNCVVEMGTQVVL